MPALTVRNIPDDVHRALKARAIDRGRSTEAEVREILAAAVKPEGRLRMGQALRTLGRKLDMSDDDVGAIEAGRERRPHKPIALDQ